MKRRVISAKIIYRCPGALKGQIKVSEDFDQTPDEIIDQFEGSGT